VVVYPGHDEAIERPAYSQKRAAIRKAPERTAGLS
jgi:hypothetical protein